VARRAFVLAALAVIEGCALFAYLLWLNLAEPGAGTATATYEQSIAHGRALAARNGPGRLKTLRQGVDKLASQSYRLATAIGANLDHELASGLGGFEDASDESPWGRPAAGGLDHLRADVGFLVPRFHRLRAELDSRREEWRYSPSVSPVLGGQFVPTSRFGLRISPFTQSIEMHRGQDLAADLHAKIVATAAGVVTFVQGDPQRNHLGKYVVIDHGGRYTTTYGHCQRIFVTPGQRVERYQVIAEVGSTGRSTGPHVHYEVRRNGSPEDPVTYMPFEAKFARPGDESFPE